jgi:hypothetical protein
MELALHLIGKETAKKLVKALNIDYRQGQTSPVSLLAPALRSLRHSIVTDSGKTESLR